MQNEILTGFIIHSRPYQEKRAIYTFFSDDLGVFEGVGRRGLPLFVAIQLFVSGKHSLKTLSQPTIVTDGTGQLALQSQCAALYMNELIYKLLPKEESASRLWQVYQQTLLALQTADGWAMRLWLRRFEKALFEQLGVALVFNQDAYGQALHPKQYYCYIPEVGWVQDRQQTPCFLGADIAVLGEISERLVAHIAECAFVQMAVLKQLGALHRLIIDELLEYRPLYSRQLWQDQARLSTKE